MRAYLLDIRKEDLNGKLLDKNCPETGRGVDRLALMV